MSTVTLTWWDSHIVGDTGTMTCAGAPLYANALNDTFTMTQDMAYTSADQVTYTGGVGNPVGPFRLQFLADGHIQFQFGGGTSNGDTTWSEPVVLNYLRDGVTWHYNTGSMDFVDAPPTWDSFTITWDGVEVDGIMPDAEGPFNEVGSGGVEVDGSSTSNVSYKPIISDGVALDGSAFVNTVLNVSITSSSIGGVIIGGMVYQPRVPNCNPSGSGTPIGILTSKKISAVSDDGSWTYANGFSINAVQFGSIPVNPS
jgi:hypothetical protein